ncbi:MAG: RNA polymerase sigma factor [Phycisphaeraceae bacterium]|nr:RNA polymerase sigma factor [Phycisphaeraceae bacterium]MCB9847001.1 RNA polymerase sigma factor [Phycisphaeraceae bacterium]
MHEETGQPGGIRADQGAGSDPDAPLVARARGGDRAALGELLTGHETMLFAVCVRTLGDREAARDITQDAMVKAIQSLDTFDGRSRFGTWITRIAINACLSHLRKQRLRKHASLDAPAGSGSGRSGRSGGAGGSVRSMGQSLPGGEPEPGSNVESAETLECLDRAMSRIDPEQRVLLSLRDVRGLDYTQIADALGVPVGTVKSRLFRARAALREAMEEAQSEFGVGEGRASRGDGHGNGPRRGPAQDGSGLDTGGDAGRSDG